MVIGNLQGTKSDGNIAVGYSTTDVNHARIARFQNDGTAKMPNPKGLHFYDRALADSKKMCLKRETISWQRYKKGSSRNDDVGRRI
ncbi:hypothetical protein [Leuconostoc citreum]|uniref:hypothetical protein n=1 Tax=Leuconostoc citreum TaxID=33964 RepID=UPI0012BA392C|nr:hypothetical protein [Leuconostoc citreum]QGN59892.1 hypothetical protein GJ636_00045 [Leuconostoc citreum]